MVLLVVLYGIFFRFNVEGVKKSSENDQLTGHFQSFFNISRTNSKISKANQSVLNLKIFHHFPKNLDKTIILTVSLSEIHRQNLIFFSTKQIIFIELEDKVKTNYKLNFY